ncbi:MAG: MarR family winged helix-turn-helix transcriptional regulator [Gemmatimonadaceae bacterium]
MAGSGVFEEHSAPIEERLAIGLYTLGLAVAHQERHEARAAGLSSAQARILTILAAVGEQTPSDLANELGVSLATVSDSVSALESKGLVERRPSPTHHRASTLSLTRDGGVEARKASSWPEFFATSIGTLTDTQQEQLLSSLLLLLRAMQENGQVPAQRMCLTCTSFRPYVRDGQRPHHCALVDAPMRAAHLRLLCADHEMASSEDQATRWQRFLKLAV